MNTETEDLKLTDERARRLGRLIRQRRTDLQMKQSDAASACQVSQAAISQWEKGLRRPTYASLVALRNGLGLEESEFDRWLELLG